jgi:hypothetical protein
MKSAPDNKVEVKPAKSALLVAAATLTSIVAVWRLRFNC